MCKSGAKISLGTQVQHRVFRAERAQNSPKQPKMVFFASQRQNYLPQSFVWCKWNMWHKICFKMRYCTDLYLIWFWIYCEKHARELGPYPWLAVIYVRSTENLLVLELCEMQMVHVTWNLLEHDILYRSVPHLVLDLLCKTCPEYICSILARNGHNDGTRHLVSKWQFSDDFLP